MFRLQDFLEEHLRKESLTMDAGSGFPFGRPVAGLHVRYIAAMSYASGPIY
jgi:hypothetical protein